MRSWEQAKSWERANWSEIALQLRDFAARQTRPSCDGHHIALAARPLLFRPCWSEGGMRHDCGLDRDLCSAVRPLRGGRERRAFERLIAHPAAPTRRDRPLPELRRRRADNRHSPGIRAPRGVIPRSVNGAAAAVPEWCIQRQFICGDACCGVETSPHVKHLEAVGGLRRDDLCGKSGRRRRVARDRCGRLSLPLRAALRPRLRAMALSTSRVGAAAVSITSRTAVMPAPAPIQGSMISPRRGTRRSRGRAEPAGSFSPRHRGG